MFCTACGAEASSTDRFCARCGRELTPPAPRWVPPGGQAGPAWRGEGRAETPAIPPVGASGTAALLVTSRGELVLANVGTRIGGFVIDLMIAGAVGFVVAMVVVGVYLVSNDLSIEDELSEAQSTEIGLIIWAVFLPPWFIATWIANAIGWSLGKRILDLRIVTAEGRPPGLGWGLGRTVAAWLSWLPLGLGFIWATWDERRQTWHDKIGGTHVVRAESLAAVEAREREVASLH